MKKGKGLALLLLSKDKKGKDEYHDEEKMDYDEDISLEDIAKDLIGGIKDDDPERVGEALKAAIYKCLEEKDGEDD